MTPSNIKVTNSVFKVIYKAYMDINQQSKRRHVVYTISTIYLCANQGYYIWDFLGIGLRFEFRHKPRFKEKMFFDSHIYTQVHF